MIGTFRRRFPKGWNFSLLAALCVVASPALAEKRIIVNETDLQSRDRSVHVRIIDDRGQTKYVTIVDLNGRPTRYTPVFGKHGELMQISYSYGKHGERHIYRVLPDNAGNIYFTAKPAGKHGEKEYVPAVKPSIPRGLTLGAPGTTEKEAYTTRQAPQPDKTYVNIVEPGEVDEGQAHVNIVEASDLAEATTPGEPVAERQGQLIDKDGNVVGFIDRKLPASQGPTEVFIDDFGTSDATVDHVTHAATPGEPVSERQGQLLDKDGNVVGFIDRKLPVEQPPTKIFIDDFGISESGTETLAETALIHRSLPVGAEPYDPADDMGDSGQIDLEQADAIMEEAVNHRATTPGSVVSGAGDDGGYTVPAQAIGENIVLAESTERETHAVLPGDHSGRADASTATGPVTSPLGALADTINDIADTARGVNETVDSVDDIADRFDDDHHSSPPDTAHTPPPPPPPTTTAMAPASGHTPPPPPNGHAATPRTHTPPPSAHTPPPAATPMIPAASGHTPPPAAATGWAVYINHDFLGVGNKANFKPGREQPVHDVATEAEGYAWLCPQISLTYMGSGGFDTPRAMFRGQEYRVRAEIQSYCGGTL